MASKKELMWLETYLQTGDDKAATRKHFRAGTEKNVSVRSSQLKAKLADEIDKRLRGSMRVNAVVMHKILCNLANNAKSEQVQAKACMDLLDRAGYKPVDKYEEVEPEKTKDQIEQEYQQAIANLPVTDLKEVLKTMPPEERQALIDSMEETSQ